MGPLAEGGKILRATSCRRRTSPVAIVVISDATANQIELVIHKALAGTKLAKSSAAFAQVTRGIRLGRRSTQAGACLCTVMQSRFGCVY
jgi:hypothetical protein